MPAAAKHAHSENTCSGKASVRSHSADGWLVNQHHRSGAGEIRDDDDGGLLQPEAAGAFPGGRNAGLVTPRMG
jgi:hypothetical protein